LRSGGAVEISGKKDRGKARNKGWWRESEGGTETINSRLRRTKAGGNERGALGSEQDGRYSNV